MNIKAILSNVFDSARDHIQTPSGYGVDYILATVAQQFADKDLSGVELESKVKERLVETGKFTDKSIEPATKKVLNIITKARKTALLGDASESFGVPIIKNGEEYTVVYKLLKDEGKALYDKIIDLLGLTYTPDALISDYRFVGSATYEKEDDLYYFDGSVVLLSSDEDLKNATTKLFDYVKDIYFSKKEDSSDELFPVEYLEKDELDEEALKLWDDVIEAMGVDSSVNPLVLLIGGDGVDLEYKEESGVSKVGGYFVSFAETEALKPAVEVLLEYMHNIDYKDFETDSD